MALFLKIESEQKAHCFDCDRWFKLYGVQKVLSGNLPQTGAGLRLPPLPNGWSWQPTCRRCGMGHEGIDSHRRARLAPLDRSRMEDS